MEEVSSGDAYCTEFCRRAAHLLYHRVLVVNLPGMDLPDVTMLVVRDNSLPPLIAREIHNRVVMDRQLTIIFSFIPRLNMYKMRPNCTRLLVDCGAQSFEEDELAA